MKDQPRAPTYAQRLRAELRTRCACLLTKAATYPLPGPGDVESACDTAIWWCERTTEAMGPDGDTAEPDTCGGPGRTCYEPPHVPGG